MKGQLEMTDRANKKPEFDTADLPGIATSFVRRFLRHIEACKRKPLAYTEALIDALLARDKTMTPTALARTLQAMIPDLPDEVAEGLIETKLRGLGLT